MHARTLLFKQLQQFFEEHLRGLWTISDVIFEVEEPGEKIRGRRQMPREIVTGMFGDWTLSIESTVEAPPLGKIELRGFRGTVTGVIDERTWRDVAGTIKQQPALGERALQNVND
jgi:hypothetical protein